MSGVIRYSVPHTSFFRVILFDAVPAFLINTLFTFRTTHTPGEVTATVDDADVIVPSDSHGVNAVVELSA